jgi:hypothetical protein
MPSTNRIASLVVLFAVGGCGLFDRGPRVIGSMRDVMRDGATQGRVDLADVTAGPHTVAIGALEGLQGEFLCLGGDVWIGRAANPPATTVSRGAAATDRATLAIVDEVPQWMMVPLERDRDLAGLEAQLAQAQAKLGLPETFPFVIEGGYAGLSAHVLAGKCPYQDPHVAVGTTTGARGRGLFVGFFTSGPAGILTHHGQRSHVHVQLTEPAAFVGHVDAVVFDAGSTLRLPRK